MAQPGGARVLPPPHHVIQGDGQHHRPMVTVSATRVSKTKTTTAAVASTAEADGERGPECSPASARR
jgi:hypothetical protein